MIQKKNVSVTLLAYQINVSTYNERTSIETCTIVGTYIYTYMIVDCVK